MLIFPVLSALLVAVRLTVATTWSPTKFAIVSLVTSPSQCIFFPGGNGTIIELSTTTGPANPAAFNTWTVLSGLDITDAAPNTDIAAIAYTSVVTGTDAVRLVYQAANGSIRTVYHGAVPGEPDWVLDPVVIATVPLGTPLSAFQSGVNGALPQIIAIQYINENGLLTQRFTTSDGINGVWSASVTITT
ncbi:hypothetical protein B0H16DRAFT_1730892 [Mycena metata]|uniref:Fucose-specific lectin n=1 Tax=Mycena metata TaxID=1033252 RepID=A0AAD7MXG4_9AGAR|nr:hypothetical protein B0H16DRAFT_1730892 [Mycena metata]